MNKLVKDLEKTASQFIRLMRIVIKGKVYEIESVNIHYSFDNLYKYKFNNKSSWSVLPRDTITKQYIHYLDYDISRAGKYICRLRINAIKNSRGKIIGPAGKTVEYIKKKIGENNLLKYDNAIVSEEGTPFLYLEQVPKDERVKPSEVFQLPRYLGNSNYEKNRELIDDYASPLMFTKSFSWMDLNYNSKILIAFCFAK